MANILTYFKETKAEMKNVTWPTRKQAINFTIVVIVVSVVLAYFLGFFDFLFTSGLRLIIS